jgi:hypothetical protein
MQPHTEAIGEVVSYIAALGYEFEGWVGEDGTRFITVYPGAGQITIVCWPDSEFFTAVSARRVSNVEGLSADHSVAYVDNEEKLGQMANEYSPPDIRLDPVLERVEGDPIEYLDGIKARGLLFVYEDDFSIRRFDNQLRTIEDTAKSIFMEMVDEFDLDLDPEDDAAADDDHETEITRSFQ